MRQFYFRPGEAECVRQHIEDRRGHGRPLAQAVRSWLEDGFQFDLGNVRLHDDLEADRLAHLFDAEAFTRRNDIFFRAGALRPDTTRGRHLLAHEMAHVVQQATGRASASLRVGEICISRVDDPSEAEADRAALALLRGKPARITALRTISKNDASLIVQRHGSFEHRLLGDGETNDLIAISTHGADRSAILQRQIQLLWQWAQNPEQVTEQDITKLCPWIRTLRLGPDQVLLTYGEVNALPDYLANPVSLEEIPKSILLPILQVIRQEGYNQLSKLLSGTDPNVTFKDSASAPWRLSLVNNIVETRALDALTMGLGVNGSNHYQGLLARNACHFAPFSWYRWQASHLIARNFAVLAYQAKDASDKARLEHQAWVYHGYADHFLQDSFAAGHLVNKTLIMQWFIEWATDQSALPFPDWDRVKGMTAARQPGLSGQQLYNPSYPGPSNDPQTVEEYSTYRERLRATGLVADGSIDQALAYQNELIFLANAATQISSANVHDHFNDNSLWVSSAAQATPYEIWGDYTLFSGANGGEGVNQTSSTAQLSQQALREILANGETGIGVGTIRDHFPTHAGPDSSHQQDLQIWSNSLKSYCMEQSFPGFLPVLTSLLTNLFSPRLGIVSQDQDFTNLWYASLPKAGYTLVDTLASGGRTFAGSNGYLYELDSTNGNVLHSLLVTGSIGVGNYETRIATDGQRLFAGIHGYVYGLSLNSWSGPWNVGVGGTGAFEPVSVLVNNGHLYAASNGYVYEIDRNSGSIIHNLRLSSIFGVGDYDARLACDGNTLYVGMHGYVYGVSLRSWSSSWGTGVGGTGAYKPVSVLWQNGSLYAGSNGYVYQIDPSNGKQLHSLLVTSAVGVGDYTTRLACDGRSLFVGVHGYVYGVPLNSWKNPWNASVGGVGSYSPVSVLVQNGRLFAGLDGYVYELSPTNGQQLQKLLLGSIFGVGNYDTTLASDGQDLCAGTHGYVYKVFLLAPEES